MTDKLKPETARRFGAMLRQAREAQGLSQAGLGERLGVAQAQVSNVESGGNVRLSTLENFARYLGYELVLVPRERVRDVAAVSAAPSFMSSWPFGVSPSALQAVTGEPIVAREAPNMILHALAGGALSASKGGALSYASGHMIPIDASATRPMFATGGVIDDDEGDVGK